MEVILRDLFCEIARTREYRLPELTSRFATALMPQIEQAIAEARAEERAKMREVYRWQF